MDSSKHHMDPTVRNLRKLEEIGKRNRVPEEVQKQIERCLHSILARDEYCEAMSSPASQGVSYIIEQTAQHPWDKLSKDGTIPYMSPRMVSGKLEGNFLKILVSMSNAKKVLEVGLFTGCGALTIAEALPADGTVVSCEILPYIQDLARSYLDKSPHGKKVTIKGGPALATIKELARDGEQFDVIFLDANKDDYFSYFEAIMDNNMLSPGGTILMDNALFLGSAYLRDEMEFGQTTHKFNEFILKNQDVYQVMVPIRDGLLMIRRKVDVEGSV
ncbi:caffeoyl-CoA O-methyltransferase-like [Pecten maximus]|uniref:caffeoyl-CoA O-methyltransferase-like n=1 Tax=Pecten maximus TaxID=6579 RepID=UPI001458FB9A|nr:caffeoyl-CoA O-methyltransferase-like [Pecten maximus]